MWKSVGSVNSPDSKSNKSRQQNPFESFVQVNRLKANQSQLTGQNSPQFMSQYFIKKKSQTNLPNRSQSQQNIQYFRAISPVTSLKQMLTPQKKLMMTAGSDINEKPQNSSFQKRLQEKEPKLNKSAQVSKAKHLKNEVFKLREDYNGIRLKLNEQLNSIKAQLYSFAQQATSKFLQIQSQKSKKDNENLISPQALGKIRHETNRFNQRIRQIQNQKAKVKEKYRLKQQNP